MPIYTSDVRLAERYQVDRATVWRWVKNGKFPKPIKLSNCCTRWDLQEVEAHDAKLKAAREASKSKTAA